MKRRIVRAHSHSLGLSCSHSLLCCAPQRLLSAYGYIYIYKISSHWQGEEEGGNWCGGETQSETQSEAGTSVERPRRVLTVTAEANWRVRLARIKPLWNDCSRSTLIYQPWSKEKKMQYMHVRTIHLSPVILLYIYMTMFWAVGLLSEFKNDTSFVSCV